MAEYTEEMVAKMEKVYTEAASDEARAEVLKVLASEFGLPEASVRMKLVSMKLYKRPANKSKTGKPVVTKNTLADRINALMDGSLTEAEVDSLTKASKGALEKILESLQFAINTVDTILDMQSDMATSEDEEDEEDEAEAA